MAVRIGQQFGNYRLLHLIGQGSLAEVYLSEHIYLGTKAVVEVLHAQLASKDVERFRAEAHTLASLKHPNIVRILDFGTQDGIPFLVTDYAPNGTLRQRHPRGIPLPPASIVLYVKQLASALQYVHDHKLIHRNVKPENMLVGQNNEILLDDFCFVSVAHSSTSLALQDSVGTVSYMAPEQLQGKPRLVSDQYALGIVVYEWLTGYRPFHGSITEIMNQHMHTPPPPLREKLPDLAPEIEEVVLISLNKDPHKRFASVQAFATAFEQACQPVASLSSSSTIDLPQSPAPAKAVSTPSSPLLTSSTPTPSPSPDQPRRFSRRTVLIGLGGLTVVGGGLTWLALQKLSTPSVHIPANLNIYVTTNSGPASHHNSIYTLRASDGTEGWRYMTGDYYIALLGGANGIVYIRTYLPYETTSGTAIARSTLLALRASDGALLWQYQVKSNDRFGPLIEVVDQGVVYISTLDQADQNVVVALRADDGALLWSYKVQGNASTKLTGLQVINGVSYISTADQSSIEDQFPRYGTVYALRASDRTLLWQYQSKDPSTGIVGIGVKNGRVKVFTYSSAMTMTLSILRASDGKLLWQHKYGFITFWAETSEVLYIAAADQFQSQSGTVSPESGTVYAVHANDGSILWQFPMDGVPKEVQMNNGVVYVPLWQKDTTLINALRASDGKHLWQKQFNSRLEPRFAVTDEAIYINTGTDPNLIYPPSTSTVYALRPSDGTPLWSYQKQGTISWLVVKDGVVYFSTIEGNTGGSVCAYQASNGTPIWCHQTEVGVDMFEVG